MGKPELDLIPSVTTTAEQRDRRRAAWTDAAVRYAMARRPGLASEVCRRHGIDLARGIIPAGAVQAAAADMREAAGEVRLLLAVLGLDEPTGPTRLPGRCACGAVLPTSASQVRDRRRAPDVCATCLRQARREAGV